MGREVDYAGMASQLQKKTAVPGANLYLTVDKDMQELAKEKFADRSGAAVVLDVNTGAVLTMYSSPSYDSNRLNGPGADAYWRMISHSPKNYLLNRAIQGIYPPASTYKIVTALAALSSGVVKPNEKIICHGVYMFGGRPYHCWKKSGHGPIPIHDAIVSSCDVFFYIMGLRLGVDKIAKYASMIGFGKKTGIPLYGEKSGLLPTSKWKLKRFGVPWQAGENLSIAVGQGYDAVTPIQNALLAAMVANGGKKLDLHIVDRAVSSNGNLVYKWKAPKKVERIKIPPNVIKIVREAMVGVVANPRGTAHRLSNFKVSMGGKTGTAQVVSLDLGARCHSEKCKDHAWFIGFSPADHPRVAASVIVEHGGFGSAAAAPIVGALMQKYYDIGYGK